MATEASTEFYDVEPARGMRDVVSQFRASDQAGRVMSSLLGVIVTVHCISALLGIVANWSESPLSWLGLLGLLVAGMAAVRFLRVPDPRSTRSRKAWIDKMLVAALVGFGLFIEGGVESPLAAQGMTNAGYSLMCAAVYIGAIRLTKSESLIVTLVLAIGHMLVLWGRYAPGIQGAALMVVIWLGALMVNGQMVRAGHDADAASDLAREAEREEGHGRVHDAMGLLRVAARDGMDDSLRTAAHATVGRTNQWLHGHTVSRDLNSALQVVAGQFPDMNVTTELSSVPMLANSATVIAVARAVHTVLGNVREHAATQEVALTLTQERDEWTLVVRDSGRGFDIWSTPKRSGLTRYTQDALSVVGVKMTVISEPEHGTTVVLRGPLRESSSSPNRKWTRFADWSSPPGQGVARAAWIADVATAALMASMLAELAIGLAAVSRANVSPRITVTLAVCASVILVVPWLVGPETGRKLAVAGSSVAVLLGGGITLIDGRDAAYGDKIGSVVMTWGCLYLAANRPDRRWVAAALAAIPLFTLGQVDVMAGINTGVWVGAASVLAGWVMLDFRRFGGQADTDRAKAARIERLRAADLLFRQMAVITAATSRPTAEQNDLFSAMSEAEVYLNPMPHSDLRRLLTEMTEAITPHRGQLRVSLVDLHSDVAPPAAAQLTQILCRFITSSFERNPDALITMSAIGQLERWQVVVVVEPAQADDVEPPTIAELHRLGLTMSAVPMPSSGIRFVIRPQAHAPSSNKLP